MGHKVELAVGGALARLRVLRVSGNRLQRLSARAFPHVRTLYADNNALPELTDARRLARLENLSLRNQSGKGLYVLSLLIPFATILRLRASNHSLLGRTRLSRVPERARGSPWGLCFEHMLSLNRLCFSEPAPRHVRTRSLCAQCPSVLSAVADR